MANNKQTKTLQFDRKLIMVAQRLAEKDRRSFNSWLEGLIIDAVEKSKQKPQ